MRELELLEQVYRLNNNLPSSVIIPPGDDMGAVRIASDNVLVTVDQIIDGVHVRLPETPLTQVGRKAITRNLSDVAAMAAAPIGAVVAAALPRSFNEADATELFRAMQQTAGSYNCPLFGGDISIWDKPLVLSVTVLAEPRNIAPVRRGGAQPGDVICVTGTLGGSLETITQPDGTAYTHHLDFEPRLHIARTLATTPNLAINSMIDLSDGLATDLGHICRESRVAAEIRIDDLPISRGAQQAAARSGKPPWRHALTDGEDYELCFTVPQHALVHLPNAIDNVPITRIGVIIAPDERATITLRHTDGTTQPLDAFGWEHGKP